MATGTTSLGFLDWISELTTAAVCYSPDKKKVCPNHCMLKTGCQKKPDEIIFLMDFLKFASIRALSIPISQNKNIMSLLINLLHVF